VIVREGVSAAAEASSWVRPEDRSLSAAGTAVASADTHVLSGETLEDRLKQEQLIKDAARRDRDENMHAVTGTTASAIDGTKLETAEDIQASLSQGTSQAVPARSSSGQGYDEEDKEEVEAVDDGMKQFAPPIQDTLRGDTLFPETDKLYFHGDEIVRIAPDC